MLQFFLHITAVCRKILTDISQWGKFLRHITTKTDITVLPKYDVWCFLSVTKREYADINIFTLTDSKKKKKKTSTAYNDHTAPSCPRQTNPGSPISQNWFLQMCFKKIKHIWCSIEQHREFVWGVCKKKKPPAFTHFCFFVPSLMSLCRYICKFPAQGTCENQITTANVQKHTHTGTHCYLESSKCVRY